MKGPDAFKRPIIYAMVSQPTNPFPRVTFDPAIMGGKPCIRGMRVTVGTVVGLVASGRSFEQILEAYPYLEQDDLREALRYAAWRVEELEMPLTET